MRELNAAQWKRVDDLLAEALEREPEERANFLAGATPEDAQVVSSLLGLESHTPTFLDGEAAEHASFVAEVEDPEVVPAAGERLGAYRLVREVGRGGMSVVYLAERDDQRFQKQVAVKVIRDYLVAPQFLARFQGERDILARLEHPAIARILDGGETASGIPYLVMEYVEGEPVDAYCDRHKLPLEARLRLFLKIGEAVAYAHQNLVVHRDLKPTNVLVTKGGEVKLLDFGIAKVLSEDGVGSTLTVTGERMWTPAYASPEQVRGEPVRTVSDVYSLGVLLYELLTGHRPHPSTLPHEVARAVLEEEPPRPSTHQRRLRGDLDAIVLKALRKEPERRHRSVDALLEDLRRHLGGQPVSARGGQWTYRLAKLARRRWATLATVSGLVILAAGLSIFHTSRIRRERDAAKHEAAKAAEVTRFLVSLFEAADPYQTPEKRADQLTARMLLDRGGERIERELKDQPEIRAEMLQALGDIHDRLYLLDRAEALLTEALALKRRLYGDKHEQVADALEDLATVHVSRGDFGRAESLYREALAIYRQRLGAESAQVGSSLRMLGNALRIETDYAAAEPALREAVQIHRRAFGQDHEELAASISTLGMLQSDRGQLDEAEVLHREALAMDQRILGPQHPTVATNLNNLAMTLKKRGDLAGAEPLYRRALELQRKVFGNQNLHVAISMNNLAMLLQDRGDLAGAAQMYREAIPLGEKVVGDGHPFIRAWRLKLGNLLVDAGDLKAADEELERALALYRKHGDKGARLPMALGSFARVPLLAGQPERAAARAREALSVQGQLTRQDHPNHAHGLVTLGWALVDLGRASEAERVLRDGVRLSPEVSSEPPALVGYSRDDLVALAKGGLGRCLLAQRRPDEAEPLLLESYQAVRSTLPYDRYYRERLRGALIRLYQSTGRPEKARAYSTR